MNRHQGFTLVELCIVMLVVGIVLVIGVMSYDMYKTKKRYDQTWENMDKARESLMAYQATQGFYPCPAGTDRAKGDADYGIAYCPTIPVGTCDKGVCRVLSARIDTDGDGVADSDRDADGNGRDIILIGTLPVTTIMQDVIAGTDTSAVGKAKLPAAFVEDGWGNRIVYAVSENLIDSGFRSDFGSIDVLDENNRSVLGANPGTAQYVLLSYGEDMAGAISGEGQPVAPCAPGLAETPNCQRTGTFVSGILSKGNNAAYYDDMLKFVSWTATNMWSYSQISPGSVFNTNNGKVGVGLNTPVQELDISGGLRATNVYVKELCDAQGENCYEPEKIGGQDPAMDCGDSNLAIKRIGTNVTGNNTTMVAGQPSVGCDTVFPSPAAINSTCAPPQFVIGYRNDTGVICGP